jgi:hypothetical protein
MSTESHAGDTDRLPQIGPVGGVVRLLLAAVLGWTVYDLWVARGFIFAETDPLTDPTLWVLTALMVWAMYEVADFVGWGMRVLAALGLLVLAAAAAALTTAGTVWAAPVTWLVWGIDIGMAALVAITFLVAVVLRTPGCELGALRQLARRLREDPDDARPMFCVAGLHKLDAWESRRRWNRSQRPSNHDVGG